MAQLRGRLNRIDAPVRYRELGRLLLFGGLGLTVGFAGSALAGAVPWFVPVITALVAVVGAILFTSRT